MQTTHDKWNSTAVGAELPVILGTATPNVGADDD